ncbi:hypothetical protein BCR43DRAFT_482868 [Syncephalastrum racemosum]|uniref:Alpha-ketoglutarate-dependent dioxygenase AlkB-like domain-containing protein n=1 Tax=Syncephalastrum racemosum TaxID=13706 RepID=A0A1X2HU99_SYNRA|nr:hypothetical protein BCR43DRAFT_482868 [Syncephalastrum racemosum]
MAPQFKSKRQQKIWEQQQREAAVQRENPSSFENQSPFRQAERYYKHTMDFSDVFDFHNLEDNIQAIRDEIVEIELTLDLREACPYPLGDPHEVAWIPRRRKAYTLKKCPGLVFIPNPLGAHEQRQLIRQCLTDYARPPNKSNLDPHYFHIPSEGLWQAHISHPTATLTKQSDQSQVPLAHLIPKLRWVTLGYQYNWTTKEYELDQRYPVPQPLADLSETVVRAISGTTNTTPSRPFKAEAGIVNFYQIRDTLQGHVDRSEDSMDAPLVSLR